jgi:hypothetical protein
MSELSWKDAIITVLGKSPEPMHYQDITEQILTGGLKTTAGATPAATVNAQIAASIKHDGTSSPFMRVAKGVFTLRQAPTPKASPPVEEEADDEVVRAFGMYWQRDLVVWRRQPALFGRQQAGAKSVDFGDQRGVYILYDHHSVVYVGRATDRPLGQRLYEHTLDRLSGRWNRFSWFGLRGVTDTGKLTNGDVTPNADSIVTALEALLIETLEPPQNRRRGDDFGAVEYIQDVDPELKEQELHRTLRNIEAKLREAHK